jgi:hypothetical protein
MGKVMNLVKEMRCVLGAINKASLNSLVIIVALHRQVG